MCFSSIVNNSGTIPQNNASVSIQLNSPYGNAQPKSDDAETCTDESNVESSDSVIIDQTQKTTKTKRKKFQKPGFTAKNKVRHFVTHDYHDLSNITKNDILLAAKLKCSLSDLTRALHDPEALLQTLDDSIDNNNESLLLPKYKRRRGVKIPFPNKLYEIVEQAANQGFDDIISWCPHGRAFIVHDGKRFEEEVMPKYFKQTCKLTSFQRQLNLYGFLRLSRPEDFGAYYHEYFLRGRDFLCDFIERTKVKGIGYKGARDPKLEPEFYRMPFVHVNKSGEKQQKVCCDDSNKVSVEPVNSCVCSVSCSSSQSKGSESESSCDPLMPPLDLCLCKPRDVGFHENNESMPCSSLERHSIDSRSTSMSVVEKVKSNSSIMTEIMPPLDPQPNLQSESVANLSMIEYHQPAVNPTNIPYHHNGINQTEFRYTVTNPILYEPYPHNSIGSYFVTNSREPARELSKKDPTLEEFARFWFRV